ncbi:hypothetical protein Calow_0187 [Caldicellulosiruptor owensensis OL]|uniref:DUF2399 domain-containing protein n=1 Tax=Caldicellulosiruptor owensensis (strain ATCC 700167 / DSM 13100 / OL) TaxID=632518 RepID=E4Q2P0_CALOW|nr:TIGR02679 domain-containing protein [Caldicellulosiruptor owensensis]ADQ03794.1 hypothetical protein Calow_0187 [Caldicellulosiruptor owensensis OL]
MKEDRLLQECIEYFSHKGFSRVLELIYNKYRSLGRFSGRVVLEKPDPVEKEMLSRYFGRIISGDRVVINVKEFAQKRFEQTKFSSLDFKDVLSYVLKKDVLTKKEEKESKQRQISDFLEKLEKLLANGADNEFVFQTVKENFKWFEGYFKKYSEEKLLGILSCSIKAAATKPEKIESLAVFATRIAHDPHFFDEDRDSGKIFLKILCLLKNVEYPKSSEEKAELLYMHNIIIDELSNWCLVYGIGAITENEKEDEALKIFALQRKPVILPLYTIKDYKQFFGYSKKIVVVENPAVFSILMQDLTDISLICTNGQLRLSTKILLESLSKAGFTIFYSGDFDPEGLLIADRIVQNYGAIPLCMDEENYLLSLSNNRISQKRLVMLRNIQSEQLLSVCRKMNEVRLSGYQEKIVDRLLKKIKTI